MSLRSVLLFDVGRIARWDVGRALRYPIPPRVLSGLVAYFVAAGGLDAMHASTPVPVLIAVTIFAVLLTPGGRRE